MIKADAYTLKKKPKPRTFSECPGFGCLSGCGPKGFCCTPARGYKIWDHFAMIDTDCIEN